MFQSSIFWNEDYQYLKPKVVLEMGVGDNNLEVDEVSNGGSNSATGIPSHVVLLASQRNMIKQLQQVVLNNNSLPGVILTNDNICQATDNNTTKAKKRKQCKMIDFTQKTDNQINHGLPIPTTINIPLCF